MSLSSSLPDSEELECPVCFNNLLPPIFQCKNGHLLCSDCIGKLQYCPVCRVRMPEEKIRNLIAESFVTKNPRGCPNRHYGCDVVLKGKELLSHSEQCEFRALKVCHHLGFPQCTQEVRGQELMSHMKSVHGFESIQIGEGQYSEIVQIGMNPEEMGGCTTVWPTLILLVQDYPPLALSTTLSSDSLSWTISVAYSEERVKRLTAEIILVLDYKEMTSLTWKGPITKLGMDNVDRNSFSVPIGKIHGLDHWSLLIKLSLDAKLIPEVDISEVSIIQPRPAASFVQSCPQSPPSDRVECRQQ